MTVMITVGAVVVSFLLTCWALIDVAIKDFGALEKKAVWGMIAFIPFIGWIVYLLWGRRTGKRRKDTITDQ